MAKKICVFKNEEQKTREIYATIRAQLAAAGFTEVPTVEDGAELLLCIGGDGTTLQAIHAFDFPSIPIVGINTGHLGFFQEFLPEEVDLFLADYEAGRYSLQPTTAVQAEVVTEDGTFLYKGFNEIVLRGGFSYSAHFNISIGESFIERFSGDGILLANSAGSTAYNYSLGGSIVDPRIKALQVTPIAPMNTTAYRSFTSSILLPPDVSLHVVPEYTKNHTTMVINDGNEHTFEDVKSISAGYSDTVVHLIRFENYEFWNKVKTKFL